MQMERKSEIATFKRLITWQWERMIYLNFSQRSHYRKNIQSDTENDSSNNLIENLVELCYYSLGTAKMVGG